SHPLVDENPAATMTIAVILRSTMAQTSRSQCDCHQKRDGARSLI
ncbi:MAG: hypothetical protein ACI9A1_002091, partial [Lentimonas sp.]